MEENKDDEISIDLSKIKNFFKRKKEEKKVEVNPTIENKDEIIKDEAQKDDDEINIDAKKSKISSIPENSDEEFSLDLSKIKNVFNKVKNVFGEESKEEKKTETIEKHRIETQDAKPTRESPITEIKSESKKQEIKEKPSNETHKESSVANEKKEIPQEKDDEIVIDFGNIAKKIKSMIGSKESDKKTVSSAEPQKKDDDEITINFSKIKNIKNLFKRSNKTTDSDEDITIDPKKIKDFFVKHRVLLLLIIPIFLSIFLRIQPAYLPITDEWATNSVMNNLRSQVSGQINQQYPNLPDQNRNALVENEIQRILQEQKSQIDQQITATSNFFKSRLQDDSGQTYLLAIDPFFWMRHAQNIINNGHPGDELREGKPWDNHMLAPSGRPVPFDMFHAYFEAFLFKFLSFFNRDLNLMTVIFFVPVLISALSVIPAFFITRKIAGNFGGFVAATIVAIHPSFLTRTVGGFADTDAYNVMFPLFIAWLFLEALDAKSTKNNIIFSAASGLLVGLFSFAWIGWWYIFDFIIASTVFYIAYYAFVHKKDLIRNFAAFTKQKAIKNSITFLLIFFIVSALSVTILVNFAQFTGFAKNPLGFAKLKEVGITTIWPNVLTTVAEQNPASLNNVINQVGLGKAFFFLIALMGIILTLTSKGRNKLWFISGTLIWFIAIFIFNLHTRLASIFGIQELNMFLFLIIIPIIIRIIIALWQSDTEIDIKYAIFLSLWFIATIFASTKGVRFTLLLVPAFAIGFGIAFGEFYRYASTWITKLLQVNKLISKTTVMVALLLLLITPYNSAAGTAKNEIPSFNDAWATSLDKIKADSQPDAIINSWWDFGHWFKFWADRAVTFDGTSQNTPPAHWVGKVLLTDDEELAIGILRMLDCSSRDAFSVISSLTNDGSRAIDVMDLIMPLGIGNAKKILIKEFNEEDAERILELTHCQPPEDYFITSEDMVGKSGVWAHFGSWDFDRGLIYNTLKKGEYENNVNLGVSFLQDRFNFSKNDAENLYYEVQSITTSSQANNWIAPWPGYAGTTGCGKLENETLSCTVAGIPLIFDLTAKEAYADAQSGRIHPKLVSFPTNDGVIVKEYNESTISLQNGRQLGIALVKNGESYQAVAMDSDLTASMFTRMFYQEGIGLKYFKKFSDERSVFGGRIIVWKVDWEGKEKTVIEVPQLEKKEETESDGLMNQTMEIEEKINELQLTEEKNTSKSETDINNSNISQNT